MSNYLIKVKYKYSLCFTQTKILGFGVKNE